MATILKNRPLVQVSFLALSSVTLLLAGCSDDKDKEAYQGAEYQGSEYKNGVSQATPHNTMDVKQPIASDTPQMSLQQEALPSAVQTAEKVVAETQPVAEPIEIVASKAVADADKVEQKAEPEQVADGKSSFSVCIGCHGANAEGGVGPRLNNQTAEVIMDKLSRYRAGEQLGAMSIVMKPIAKELSDAQIKAIAEYVVTLN